MKNLLKIIAIFWVASLFSQKVEKTNFSFIKVDSILISTIDFKDKTTNSSPLIENTFANSIGDNECSFSVLKTKKLNSKEEVQVQSLFFKGVTGRGLLFVYDIRLYLYEKGLVKEIITISSLTENLTIYKRNKKSLNRKIDANTYINSDVFQLFYQGRITEELKLYLKKFLRKEKMWLEHEMFISDY